MPFLFAFIGLLSFYSQCQSFVGSRWACVCLDFFDMRDAQDMGICD